MNDVPLLGSRPPPGQQINLEVILQIRLALDQIKEPSTTLKQCIQNLDQILLSFTSSLSTQVTKP